jgi:uncharacterized protein (DUF849 family)
LSRDVILTCAVTGGADTVGKHPAIPVTPAEIAKAVIDAAKAGAAIAHIHVRDPATGKVSLELDLYREVVDRIRDSGSDVIINLTTGPGARFVPSEDDPAIGGSGTQFAGPLRRIQHIEALLPEICSLDIATMNFGEAAMINTPSHLRTMAKRLKATRVRPELEVFDAGHVVLARKLIDDGFIAAPALFQLCLGVPWGVPATAEGMLYMRSLLPPGSMWAAFGISKHQFPMVAQATILGGHVRVGLEDNLYIEPGVFAPDNAALVEKAVRIVHSLGERIATPARAREILGIGTDAAVPALAATAL